MSEKAMVNGFLGEVPRPKPEGPRDLLRDSIDHDTPPAFPNLFIFSSSQTSKAWFFKTMVYVCHFLKLKVQTLKEWNPDILVRDVERMYSVQVTVYLPPGKSDNPWKFPRANFSRQPLQTFHCLYQCTVNSVHSVDCSVYTVQCGVFRVHCTMSSVQCTLYSVDCSVYTVQCGVFRVHKTSSVGWGVSCRHKGRDQ